MRQLIINADDFGMSYEVNEGIKRCIEAGTVNSTSLLVNMPYFEDAVEYLRTKPNVSVGLHFNITEGKPIDLPAQRSTLIREDDNFVHWVSLTFKLLTNNCSIKEIKYALTTQYEKLEKTGLPISHIDSHHHIHLYPSIYRIVLDFAHRKNTRSLRSRNFNLLSSIKHFRAVPTLKEIIILSLCFINTIFFSQTNGDILEVVGIYDMSWDSHVDKDKFYQVISRVKEGVSEIICHPAIYSKTGNPKFLKARNKTLEILTSKSFQKHLMSNNIQMFKRNGHA